jgi:glycosyltransferase involved in cell wall biosynthesis
MTYLAEKSLKFAVLLPHLKLYGGVKRFLELGNLFVSKGHKMTVFTPSGADPDWFNFDGQIRPMSLLTEDTFDIIFFTEISLLDFALKARAERKVFYIVLPVNLNKIKKYPEIEFFANSSNLLEFAREKYGIDAFPAIGGLNLANLPFIEKRSINASEPFTVLVYGRIAEGRKGTMFVVRACERLLRKGFKVNLILFDTLVTENIRIAYKKFKTIVPYEFIIDHPIERNAELFHRADIFVAAERKTGYANTVAEAMACGTPVIATNSGTKDLLFDHETGLLVTRNSRKIAKAILKLLNEPDLRAKISTNARKKVEGLNWESLADRIIENFIN